MNETPRYPYFGQPPARQPRPASDVPTLRGKRVVLSLPDGFVYDVRAVSEVYKGGNGRAVVDVVSEEDYFRWMFTHSAPASQAYPSNLVWVEG